MASPVLNSVALAKSDIAKGSKSFSFASLIFSERQREASWQLYAWCRRSDDAIDDSPTHEQAFRALEDLKLRTRSAFRGDLATEHPWVGLREIAKRYSLPETAAMDMLRGFEMDLGILESSGVPVEAATTKIKVQMNTWDDLLDYCYCVAGTVGLLMCPIMGVKNPDAGRSAVAMGSAMQLTNIARDIKEDFERGRIYLPLEELRARGLHQDELLDPKNRMAVFAIVRQMLERAEDMYTLGEQGLRYLPFRAAWAVQVAASIYRDIGRKVLERGSDTDYPRVVVGRGRKIVLFFLATVGLFKSRFAKTSRRRSELVKEGLDGINIISS